jgi:DNA-binding NarL/FixJ family response regulator
MENYRIIVADDHVLFRQGLRGLLLAAPGLEVAGEAGDGLELLELLKTRKSDPHLVILDISMPNLRGIEAIPEIKALCPGVKLLIVTMHADKEYLYQTLAAGVNGYFLKKDAGKELFSAIETIRRNKTYVSPHLSEALADFWAHGREGVGGPVLSNREREVLKLIAEGKSNKDVAQALFISVHTVERHRANLMRKLSLKKTADLVKYAIQKGYI